MASKQRVQRGDLPLDQLRGLIEQPRNEIGRCVVERIDIRKLPDVEHVIEDESHFTQWCGERCHVVDSER